MASSTNHLQTTNQYQSNLEQHIIQQPNEITNQITNQTDEDPELRQKLETAKKELNQTLLKKRKLDKELASLEATLYADETAYLTHPTANSFGNIVKGYEAYVKAPPSVTIGANGISSVDHHSTRRKRTTTSTFGTPSLLNPHTEVVGDAERVFSKSSGSYLRALESRNRDQESAITSEQESVAQSLIQSHVSLPPSATTESRKKIKT
ncbi:histone acetyltransferase subunit NuA4-domain-containing protein [Melampsora americana]|nr:histone acetyltransferase subunit NuA4-domain-containing protein [Melampsora americana]